MIFLVGGLWLKQCSTNEQEGEQATDGDDDGIAKGESRRPGDGKGPDGAGLDPSTPAAIFGTVTGMGGQPLGGVQVCARAMWAHEDDPKPPCTTSGDDGHYRLADLQANQLRVHASAPRHQAANATVRLRPGQEEQVDLDLLVGGVEIQGVVYDLSGGEVEGALITISGDPIVGDPDTQAMTFSDAQGRFRTWVRPGRVQVRATANGYARRWQYSAAPGPTVEVYLVPEAVLVGRVVDAESGRPVAGVEIDPGNGGGGMFFTETSHGWARSDDQG
ncbi:MAG: carboxypeptidase regulatory-like domain-containing protein, partial [Myxococcales bacterium]|nr:carboxypeptidase regulatory-like domain-containing protein [Myxococcales bacterium]